MLVKETFGEHIRKLREELNLPIRKVAAVLDIDPSTLSKIERSERNAPRGLVKGLSEIFCAEYKDLLIRFLSDKVAYQLKDEEYSAEVLKVAEQEIKYLKSKNYHQTKLNLK